MVQYLLISSHNTSSIVILSDRLIDDIAASIQPPLLQVEPQQIGQVGPHGGLRNQAAPMVRGAEAALLIEPLHDLAPLHVPRKWTSWPFATWDPEYSTFLSIDMSIHVSISILACMNQYMNIYIYIYKQMLTRKDISYLYM